MTLDEFIAESTERSDVRLSTNGWVSEHGFKSLYVRRTGRWLEDRWVDCLDLANITASKPGNGAFKALVARLRLAHPELTLFVEAIGTKRFMDGLLRMGFVRTHESRGVNAYLLGVASPEAQ